MNKLIIDTLEPIGVPVALQTYTGKETTYITFFTYLAQGEQFADDEEIVTGHYIQVDVWSKGNYVDVVDEVKNRMKQAGFRRRLEHDLYENDTKIYHKVLRFVYEQEEILNGD